MRTGEGDQNTRVVVIGGTVHVGTYLVLRLITSDHEVIVVSRGKRRPYQDHPAWEVAQHIQIKREVADRDDTFGQSILDLRPDVVIDMLCFRSESAQQLVEAVRGKVQPLICCGTIWVNGYSVQVPTAEDQVRNPFGEYGIQKHQMEL